jgi:pimeloyl-ACP methyl ester carboxylesterase
VAVLPARSRDVQGDPLFLLAGGPGQGATATFGAVLPLFEDLADRRDLVLVDMRGTGRSGPLRCDSHAGDLEWDLAEQSFSRLAAECRPTLDADLSRYTTPVLADDLDDVRRALGYSRINLYGGSYGTRLALVYLRRHGEHVRSLVLDGVAPVDMSLPLSAAEDGQRAFERLAADCAAEPACAEAYPELPRDLAELLASLESHPEAVELRHPRTGEALSLRIGRSAFAGVVQALLYSTELSALLPLTVARAKAGDFAPFVAQADLLSAEHGKLMSIGLLLSVVCTEDVDRAAARAAEAELGATFLRDDMVVDWARACADWPRAELPAGYFEPIRSERPTLVLSGDLDPITPARWGAAAAEHLPRSTHLVVPAVGHGTIAHGCVSELVAEFVDAASAASLDRDCVDSIRRPPFFVNSAGPVP